MYGVSGFLCERVFSVFTPNLQDSMIKLKKYTDLF